MFYKIPVTAEPYYNFSQIFTEGTEVTFTIRWNGQADCYFMDILENYDDPTEQDLFISSIPVTDGINLINQYEFKMLAVNCVRVNADPEIDNDRFVELGDTFHVYVTTEDEVA